MISASEAKKQSEFNLTCLKEKEIEDQYNHVCKRIENAILKGEKQTYASSLLNETRNSLLKLGYKLTDYQNMFGIGTEISWDD